MDIAALPDLTWKLIYYFMLQLGATIVVTEAVTEFIVESDPLEGFREWIGSKSTILGLGVTCGVCFSFWVAVLAGGYVARSWWLQMGWYSLAIPALTWRWANLYHDLLSYLNAKKEALLSAPVVMGGPGKR